jgi:nitrous oxidase accessory protein NosD
VNAEEAARRFLAENPEVRYLLIGAAIAIVIATLAEDIATLGAGILDDPASLAVAYALVRVAQSAR